MDKKLKGMVIQIEGTKALLLVDSRIYYIIVNKNYHEGDIVEFFASKSLPMPSYMFAIAAMSETDLDATLDDIKKRWNSEWDK